MVIRLSVLALTLLVATETVARADAPGADAPGYRQQQRDVVEQIVRGGVRKARRAIAIGPTFGMFSAYAPGTSDFEGALSFGLELEVFKTPFLSPGALQEMVKDKAKAKLLHLVKERFRGVPPSRSEMKRLAREVLDEVKAELIAEIAADAKTVERPRFNIHAEANYLFSSADWLARIGFAYGFSIVSLGPTFSMRFGDDTVARLGGELAVHVLPTKSMRSPVFDLFLRGDFELHKRETDDDQVVLGARVLLDVL